MLERLKRFLGLGSKPAEAEPVTVDTVDDQSKNNEVVDDQPKNVDIVDDQEKVQQQEDEKVTKPRIGYVHLSGCTGDVISLTENYDILADLLTDMVDIVYGQTLVDLWEMPEMDLVLVEGSVCLQDEHSMKELKELREKAKLVCAFGSCAMTGCFTRFARGGQQAQPQHESFLPIGEVIDIDCAIPGCPCSPEIIAKTVVALINEDMDYLAPMLMLADKTEGCGCDLQNEVINVGLCTACGTCAMACQTRAITMNAGRPEVNKDRCIKCGICSAQCPRTWFPEEQIKKDLGL